MRDTDKKRGRIEGKLRLIVDHAVNGREDAPGNDNGRCRSGGRVIFSAGSLCGRRCSQFPIVTHRSSKYGDFNKTRGQTGEWQLDQACTSEVHSVQ